ncbi:MAG TPA: radical SAM protein, partial [Elusimicrobiales bacterium]|nr:radical SAM protein [Elusimicrobiales bacterium]
MKVLLVNPPDSSEAMLGAGRYLVPRYEPLGLLYIAAALRANGFGVELIDAFAEGIGLDTLKERIAGRAPDIVGVSTLTCSGANVFELGRWLKKSLPEALVVLGNMHASVYSSQYLENGCCDVVVHGEGELPMVEIARARAAGQGPEGVRGVSFLGHNGSVVHNPGRDVPQDLEKLPPPARDLLDQSLYGLGELSNQAVMGGGGVVARTISTSRGCPFGCSFCAAHGRGVQRFNSADRVVDEMEVLEKGSGASYITIVDPFFLGDRDRVLKICSEIRARGLRVRWGCDAHINSVDPGLIAEMERAGCYELSFGIESGVQRLLDAVGKPITPARVSGTLSMVKAHSGIKLSGLFILGLPGETYADSLETIRFAKSLPLDMAQFSLLIPYPGSALFDELSAKGE